MTIGDNKPIFLYDAAVDGTNVDSCRLRKKKRRRRSAIYSAESKAAEHEGEQEEEDGMGQEEEEEGGSETEFHNTDDVKSDGHFNCEEEEQSSLHSFR